MNPGITEEVGKTTRSFIETMKHQPAMLVLSLSNVGLVCFLYFALNAAAQFRTELLKMNFDFQKHATELLARCVVPRS